MTEIPYVPMELTLAPELPVGKDWIYEPKADGYRALGSVAVGSAVLVSKTGKRFNQFPEIARQLQLAFPSQEVVVDGELIGLDENHNVSFSELHKRRPNAAYLVFDLLERGGKPLIDRSLKVRRRILDEIMVPQSRIQPMIMVEDRDIMLQAAHQTNFEGVIAKRLSSKYQSGKRSRDWQKQRFADYPTGFGRK